MIASTATKPCGSAQSEGAAGGPRFRKGDRDRRVLSSRESLFGSRRSKNEPGTSSRGPFRAPGRRLRRRAEGNSLTRRANARTSSSTPFSTSSRPNTGTTARGWRTREIRGRAGTGKYSTSDSIPALASSLLHPPATRQHPVHTPSRGTNQGVARLITQPVRRGSGSRTCGKPSRRVAAQRAVRQEFRADGADRLVVRNQQDLRQSPNAISAAGERWWANMFTQAASGRNSRTARRTAATAEGFTI